MKAEEELRCSFSGCGAIARGGGMCWGHEWQAKRGRRLTPILRTTEERFLSKVDKADGCWNWIGATSGNGYGRFCAGGKHYMAHRWNYERARGPVPPGLEIDHLCRNRRCVNPEHLEAVTRSVNQRRGIATFVNMAAQNKAKTRCPAGHEYTPENTKIHGPTGRRHCRNCANRQLRELRARRRADKCSASD